MNRQENISHTCRLIVFVCFVWVSSLHAQKRAVDLDLHYTTEYSHIATDCVSCLWLNGGGAEIQVAVSKHLNATLNVTVTDASNIRRLYSPTPLAYDLQRTTFLGGVSYFPTKPATRFRPFADVLVGGAYATGALAPGNTSAASSGAFAVQGGVGISIRLSDRWSFSPMRVDFLLTTFGNPGQEPQDALRLSSGVTFRLRGAAARNPVIR